MRTTSVVLFTLAVSLCATATAQDVGYLSPRANVAFVAVAGAPFTTVDFSHPATTDGLLTTATIRWTQAPAAGCTAAMKLKLVRPTPSPFGNLFVVAERGPFDMVNGFNTVTLSPSIPMQVGDYLAIVQTRGDPCGGMAVSSSEAGSMLFQFQSDLTTGTWTSGDLRRGLEFGARASAAVSVLTNVLTVAGSARGAFGSNFKTSAQLVNISAFPIKGNLVFHPAGRSAAAGDPSLSYNLNGFDTVYYDDVIAQMGQSGVGSLDVMSTTSGPPVISVRVYNDAGTAGTAGFTEDVLRPDAALQRNEFAFLTIPSDAANFRMNVGVRSLSEGATLVVSVNDQHGFSIGSPVTKAYGVDFFEQTTGQLFFGDTPLPAGGYMRVLVTAGSAFVYGSTTDNRTNDSQIQFAARR
jgi:hypothetical protein